jgi:hypothetical protein
MTTPTANEYEVKADELWESFDDNAKFGCKFGMFPADPMMAAERDGYTGRPLVLALMNKAANWQAPPKQNSRRR